MSEENKRIIPCPPSIRPDPWTELRKHTTARVALGRAGGSMPTAPWLEFKAAHASARDAVWDEFEIETLTKATGFDVRPLMVQSMVDSREEYLRRPDLGRRLNEASREILKQAAQDDTLVIVVGDGLSARAAQSHAPPLLTMLLPMLRPLLTRPPMLVIARYARVALQDEIGWLLKSRLALILIGERPGLGSPDSLGAYLVHDPKPGRTDAERNCVSNIRPEGLAYEQAADTLHYLLCRAWHEGISGIRLKDHRELHPPLTAAPPTSIAQPER